MSSPETISEKISPSGDSGLTVKKVLRELRAFKPLSAAKVALGTPFGSNEAISQILAETRAKHHALLQKLAVFPDPRVALSLLRYCLGAQKINHR